MCIKTITSEYVSYGHPDKIADQIADSILDEYLKVDKNVRAGIEVMVKDNFVILGGEINSNAVINYDNAVRKVFENLKFPSNHNLSPSDIKIINLIGKQSTEIHNGVDKKDGVIGAGDQGIMFGMASNETDVYMPLGCYIAKKICDYIASLAPGYGPDVKSQVSIEYNKNNNENKITHILVSAMHQASLSFVQKAIMENKIGLSEKVYLKFIKNKNIQINVNPCGEWHIGGPVSDCGVTGRKIVVDAYGGYCKVGGGAYSGKDCTKVDRSAAYMARYIAKNIVASGICNTAKVSLAYMIGVAEPTVLDIEMDVNNDKTEIIKDWIKSHIDLTPKGIIDRFNGSYPRYYHLAHNGHYGVEVSSSTELSNLYPWEKLDIFKDLKNLF